MSAPLRTQPLTHQLCIGVRRSICTVTPQPERNDVEQHNAVDIGRASVVMGPSVSEV